jgi:hypothetical protein
MEWFDKELPLRNPHLLETKAKNIYGDTLPLKNIGGKIANTKSKYRGTDCYQEVMENMFRDVTDAEVYNDDIGAFSHSWKDHMAHLCIILTKLQDNCFSVNPRKCDWAVKETDWLGYWLTPSGLKPRKTKIDAVLRMQAPSTL